MCKLSPFVRIVRIIGGGLDPMIIYLEWGTFCRQSGKLDYVREEDGHVIITFRVHGQSQLQFLYHQAIKQQGKQLLDGNNFPLNEFSVKR